MPSVRRAISVGSPIAVQAALVSLGPRSCASLHTTEASTSRRRSGESSRLSDLDLRTRKLALKGGKHGAALVPGSPEKSRLYRMVTGDTNAPRFPQMAVRWLTPPQDIAAFVTSASLTRLESELFHFGDKPRPMEAELRMLEPGNYRVTLATESAKTTGKPRSVTVVAGRFTRVSLTLPAQQPCRLRIEKASAE